MAFNSEAEPRRRQSDTGFERFKIIGERVLLWATVVALLISSTTSYVRMTDVVTAAPEQTRRLSQLETWKAVQDDRWARIEKFMNRIEHKIDNE
jgi:hypothetical protein